MTLALAVVESPKQIRFHPHCYRANSSLLAKISLTERFG
jgi:hypothetical protein